MKYRLEELVDLQIGRTPPRKEFEWFNTNGDGYKWVSIKDMGNSGRFISDTSEYLTEAAQKRFGIPIVEKGTLLLSFKLTVGRLCITTDKMLTNEAIAQLPIKDTNIVDRDFLYYYLKNYNFHQLGSTSSIATAINSTYLKKMEIDLPPIDQQRAIAAILSPIDDKIESNNAINNNLQHQAKALFQDWFVDFAPFGGVMPSDWKNGKLKDVIRLKRNAIKAGEDPSLPYLPIDIIPMNTFAVTDFKPNSEAQSSLITFDRDDIVIGAMRVYFHRVICAPCTGITRTTCFTLAPFDTAYLSFALLCCDQNSSIDYAQTTSKGSTMPYAVWEGGFGDMDILIPTREIALKFNELVLPMLRIIQSSYFENHHLRTVRDILLTKLLSGEIDVSDVEF